jgi:uncharacterized protein (DUF305 family)
MVFDTRQLGVILLTAAALGCHGAAQPPLSPPSAPVVQPGAPGEPGRTVEAGAAPRLRHTSADTRFMQGMIGHHAQAIEMTDLLKTRTTRDDMKLLALRIDVSQTDEIRMMKRWLLDHGETVPDDHAHHMSGATLMPGMLTADDMAKLAAAKGADFDRLFLEFMIKHHEGALVMVKDLFAAAGAAQDSDIFAFASDVEADQLIEIRRMRGMLAAAGR